VVSDLGTAIARDATGQLNAVQFDCVIEAQQVVKLASPVVGVIARLNVDRGDTVLKGQVLGKLEDDLEAVSLQLARVRARNEYSVKSIQARLEFLRSKLERADELFKRGTGTRATFDEADADAKVTEQQLREAEINLEFARLEVTRAEVVLRQRTLTSPFDGVVVERLLLPGEYRNEQGPVLTLAQINPLRVEVFVPTRYYGLIRVGTRAIIQPEQPIGGNHSASVTVVDRVMDAASGTFGVRLNLPNEDFKLPAGVRCKIRFEQ
jgi:RND family efflux transporter MFP subunit